jgi:hypothetical protein
VTLIRIIRSMRSALISSMRCGMSTIPALLTSPSRLPEMSVDRLKHRDDLGCIADIRLDRDRLAAGGLDFRNHPFCSLTDWRRSSPPPASHGWRL